MTITATSLSCLCVQISSVKTGLLDVPVPAALERALQASGLTAEYRARPRAERFDYYWWISGAHNEQVERERIAEVLELLAV